MIVDVWAPLVLPLLLALPLLRTLPDRLPPRLAAWLFTATAVGAAGASTTALGLLALAGLLHLPFVAALGHLDLPVARHLDPAAIVPVGMVAAVLLAVLAARAARVTVRHLRDHAAARRLVRCAPEKGELLVLPDARPDAYAVPAGRRSRIVVTEGMLAALDAREREVLLAHERAHLRGGHHRFLLLVDLAVALHPLLGRVRDGVAYSI
ncbi:M48 family metalloprotease, partial [Streptacidiphilus monticola]